MSGAEALAPSRDELLTALDLADTAGDTDAVNELTTMLDKAGEQQDSTAASQKLTQDMVSSITNLPTAIGDSLSKYADPDTWSAEAIPGDPGTSNPITAGANVILPASEAIGALTATAWHTWWDTFGRALPEGSKDAVAEGFATLTSGVVGKWDAFKKAYPFEAKMLGDTGVVLGAFGPKVKLPGLEGAGLKQLAKGNTKAIELRRKGIYGLVRKPDSSGIIEESSVLTGRHQKWDPDLDEKNMAWTMETIDDVDPNKSYIHNYRAVEKATLQWKDALWKRLGKYSNRFTDKADVLGDLKEVMNDLPAMEGYHMLSPDAQVAFASQMKEAHRLISQAGTKNKLRPRDLYTIRQEFDNLFRGSGGSLEQATSNARTLAAKSLRDLLNKKLRDVTKDPDIYDWLDRQHEGLKALDVMRPKRAKERTNMFTRWAQKVKEAGHLPSTPLALYATAGLVASAGAPVLGTVAAAAGTGVAAYQVYKGLTGPARHKAIAKLISVTNAASKKDASFAAAIAPERALLIEILKESQRDGSSE